MSAARVEKPALPLYEQQMELYGHPENGLAVRLSDILATASVAYQKGHIKSGDKLMGYCRSGGYAHWLSLPPEDCEAVLGNDNMLSISGDLCEDDDE